LKPTTIFLDLDDVLNCCTMAALRYVGCPVEPLDFRSFNPEWGFDIIRAANNLHPTYRSWTQTTFWQAIKRDFWATAIQSQEFEALLVMCEDTVGLKNTFILTCPTDDPECPAGKLKWIQLNCPPQLHRQYMIGEPKFLCARPDSLLVDDSDKNVNLFREKGGQAILLPRPWNSGHKCGVINQSSYLRYTFDGIFGRD